MMQMNGDLRGRKQVRIRLRRNLVFTLHHDASQPYYVLKDPIGRRYFRFDEGQHFILEMMDGKHTLADIQKAFEDRFRPERLSPEELEGFAAHLVEAGLAQSESGAAHQHLFEQEQERRRRETWLSWLNVFCWRMPLVRDTRFLDALVPLARQIFRPASAVFVFLAVLAALGLVVSHWSEFLSRLPATHEFFSFHFLLYLGITLGLAKTVHELGHALCCKAFGGEVHELGVMLLFFFPAMYCDVSDSWTLPGKWRRMAVSAAGIFVELALASLATFVWWLSAEGTTLAHLSFALMAFCGLHTLLCNANPLMRFDGYYVLSDWLEVPNLAQQASRQLDQTLWRSLGANVAEEAPVGKASPRFLVLYAAASLVYRWIMWATALFFVYQFLKAHRLESLGILVVAAGAIALLAGPLHGLVRAVGRRGVPDFRPARVYVFVFLLLGATALGLLVPFSGKVHGVALVQIDPDHVRRVVVPDSGGFLKELLVHDGQMVRAGDVLAVLSNPQLESKIRVNEAEQGLKRDQQLALVGQLTQAWTSTDQGHFAVLCDFEQRALLQQHATLKTQVEQLTLRAPCDGVVMGLRSPEEQGKWLEKGTQLCRVGNPRTLRAVMLLEPAEHRELMRGRQASFTAHGAAGQTWRGVVTGISSVEARNIPPQLALRAGGDVPTDKDPVSKQENPTGQHFQVAVRILDEGGTLHPGVLGRVRIDGEPHTLWQRLRGALAKTFR